jgi:hypothetical protein
LSRARRGCLLKNISADELITAACPTALSLVIPDVCAEEVADWILRTLAITWPHRTKE